MEDSELCVWDLVINLEIAKPDLSLDTRNLRP